MKLTNRDIELLRWINGFGCVFTHHVANWMGVRYATANNRVYKLKQAGFLRSEYKFVSLPHLLFLTRDGWLLTGDTLPVLKTIKRLQTFSHDIKLVDLSLILQRRIRNSCFVAERRIQHNKSDDSKGHSPDGLLYLPEKDKPVAIELELTQKKASRLSDILDHYRSSFAYDRVWYFTTAAVTGFVRDAIGGDPLFMVSQIRYTPCL